MVFAAAGVLALLAAACAGDDGDDDPASSVPPVTTQQEQQSSPDPEGEPVEDETVDEASPGEQEPVGEPAAGEPAAGEPAVGEPAVGEPVVEEPVVEEEPDGPPHAAELAWGNFVLAERIAAKLDAGDPLNFVLSLNATGATSSASFEHGWADDLAMFAVAWRDGHDMSTGELPAFPPECAARSGQQNADLAMLAGTIAALDPNHADYLVDLAEQQRLLNDQRMEFRMEPLLFPAPDPADLAAAKDELKERFDALESRLKEWEDACKALSKALLRDLGYLGVDMGSLRGFYSDSLAEAPEVPCRTSEQTVVRDAVHVALAANWQDAGWAAAQVWPDGLPMAAESIGRMSQRDRAATAPVCGKQLELLDTQGRPVWAVLDPAPSRRLAQSVGRTPLSG